MRTGWLYAVMVVLVAWGPIRLSYCSAAEEVQTPVDCELRIVWGGPKERQFEGTLNIGGGQLELRRNLSLHADSLGKVRSEDASTLRIMPHSPSRFGGADVRVIGRPDSMLSLEFRRPDADQLVRYEVELKDLLQGTWLESLDEIGSSVAIERQVFDKLRVDSKRRETIFDTEEEWSFSVRGYLLSVPSGEYRLRARLLDSDGGVVTESIESVRIDELGNFPSLAYAMQLPAREGPGRLELSLRRKNFISNLVSTPPTLTRRVDFIALDPQAGAAPIRGWKPLLEFNAYQACHSGNWSWLVPLGNLPGTLGVPANWQAYHPLEANLPTVEHHGELGSRSLEVAAQKRFSTLLATPTKMSELKCLTIGPGGWLAIPLRGLSQDRLHRVRLEVPTDQAMELAVSVRKLDASGRLGPLSRDFGLRIDQRDRSAADVLTSHEVLFWPTSQLSYLLIANPSEDRAASLARLHFDIADTGSGRTEEAAGMIDKNKDLDASPDRLVGFYLDQPLLADAFAATREADPVTQRMLESWSTWNMAAERIEQYMDHAGYNVLMLKAFVDSGGIFPSDALQPNRRFDSGTFFTDGRSVEIKDGVELLLRRFDRVGKKLVVGLDLDSRLPRLDRWERAKASEGLYQQSIAGPILDGQGKQNHPASTYPRYNPLDARVQTELISLVRELSTRYGDHPSFAGLMIELDGDSQLIFAGDRWGYDPETLDAFQQHIQAALPGRTSGRRHQANDHQDQDRLEQLFAGPLRLQFLQWRADRLKDFYARLAEALRVNSAQAGLYLNTLPLAEANPQGKDFYFPESIARNPSEQLLGHGVDVSALKTIRGLIVTHGQIERPRDWREPSKWNFQLSNRRGADGENEEHSASLRVYHPESVELHSLDRLGDVEAFPSSQTLYPHFSHVAGRARQELIVQLYESDAVTIARGGWLPLAGQEETLRPLVNTLRRLPPRAMSDVKDIGLEPSNLKIRSVDYAGKTYIQVLNNAPWDEQLHISFRGSRPELVMRNLTDGSEIRLSADDRWKVELRPFDLIGFEVDDQRFKVVGVQRAALTEVVQQISDELTGIESLIARAADPTQQRQLAHLGGDFEQWDNSQTPRFWNFSSLPGVQVSRSSELPRSGRYCLTLLNRNQGDVSAWIQSRSFDPPKTGRLAVRAWFRAPATSNPMHVRLSLIGRLPNGGRYVRYQDIGRRVDPLQGIANDWGRRPVELHISDVPQDVRELHVAIDLIGSGLLYIDDLKVNETLLHPDERIFLSGQVLVAKQRLDQGNPVVAEQLLSSPWGKYLLRVGQNTGERLRVADHAGEQIEVSSSPDSAKPVSQQRSTESSQTILEQWRDSVRGRWK